MSTPQWDESKFLEALEQLTYVCEGALVNNLFGRLFIEVLYISSLLQPFAG